VAFHQWNLLMDPQRDLKTGDVHGPLLEVLELQQIENSYTMNDDKKCALEGVVAKALTNEGKYCSIHYEEKAAAYHEMYENAEKDADEVVVAALERDTIEYIKRREERIAKRMIRIRSIYASLEEILVDCPFKDLALDCTWLEVRRIAFPTKGSESASIFTCYSFLRISHYLTSPQNDERCVKFTCHIVEQNLSNIISAPASASDRTIM
jgi:hypothetical protein